LIPISGSSSDFGVFAWGFALLRVTCRTKGMACYHLLQINGNASSEQSDAMIWRLPAEQGIEWGKFNRRAPRHHLECKSVKRLSGLSNH
jgi:hypothetical protein